MKIFFILCILAVGIVFGMYNAHPVEIFFFHYQTPPLPLSLVILAALFLGFFPSALLGLVKTSRLKRQLNQSTRENEDLKKDLEGAGPKEEVVQEPAPQASENARDRIDLD